MNSVKWNQSKTFYELNGVVSSVLLKYRKRALLVAYNAWIGGKQKIREDKFLCICWKNEKSAEINPRNN